MIAATTLPAIDEVSLRGLAGSGDREAVLDVLFDDRPVWSLHFLRDSQPDGDDRRLVPWPDDLRRHLDGVAMVSVRDHLTGAALFEAELQLGSGARRIAVVDDRGRPLSVNAKGRLTAALSQRGAQVVETMLDAAEDVLRLMRDAGVEGFLSYGTLLGAVRTGHVIGHDYDADLSYLSRYEHPVDAIRESYRVERAIRAGGYSTSRYSAISFRVDLDPDDPDHPWLDVFGALIVAGTLYAMGEVGAPVRRDQVLPLGSHVLEGRELPTPRDVDAWLTATYGPSWRVPDPAFHFDTPLATKRRLSGWFRRLRRDRTQWDAAYRDLDVATVPYDPSDFARWVGDQADDVVGLVDVGCGMGTDALWFAGRGLDVVGLDFSDVALRAARGRAEAAGVSATFERVNLADLRSVLAAGAALTRRPGPRALTARLVVDAHVAAERANLWQLARMALRSGGELYLEIASPRDPRHPSFAAANRLRRLAAPVLQAELERSGATVVRRLNVASPGEQEPDMIRMVVAWR